MKKAKLIALAKTIISTSFPALRGLTLNLEIVETDDFVMAVSIEDREIHLEVSREDAARMGRSVVTGVLAHELCHAEEDCRHGPLLETLFWWLSERIPSLRTRMERRIDIAVIRKGLRKRVACLSAIPRPVLRAVRSNRRHDRRRNRGSAPSLLVTVPRSAPFTHLRMPVGSKVSQKLCVAMRSLRRIHPLACH